MCKCILYNNFKKNERIYNSESVCEYNLEGKKKVYSLSFIIKWIFCHVGKSPTKWKIKFI